MKTSIKLTSVLRMATLMEFVNMFDKHLPEMMKPLRTTLGNVIDSQGKDAAYRVVEILFSEETILQENYSWLKNFCIQYVKQYEMKP